MRWSTFKVEPGEVWEFYNPEIKTWERYALFWIVRADRQDHDPDKDLFTYIQLDSSESDMVHMTTAHLTIRCEYSKELWKRLV